MRAVRTSIRPKVVVLRRSDFGATTAITGRLLFGTAWLVEAAHAASIIRAVQRSVVVTVESDLQQVRSERGD